MRTPGKCAQECNFLGEPFSQCGVLERVRKMVLVLRDFSKGEGNWMSPYSSLTPFQSIVKCHEEHIAPTRASVHQE